MIVLGRRRRPAFCTGGDQSAHDGNYDGRGTIGLPIEELQSLIRDVPKPVIARVQGYRHRRRQRAVPRSATSPSPPRRRSSARSARRWARSIRASAPPILARVVGEKKAREIWYLCRRYTAQEALAMGLVNAVRAARPARRRGRQVVRRDHASAARPRIAIAKRSFNADTENIRGIGAMGMQALTLYYETEESKEGVRAFHEKRKPDFRRFVK